MAHPPLLRRLVVDYPLVWSSCVAPKAGRVGVAAVGATCRTLRAARLAAAEEGEYVLDVEEALEGADVLRVGVRRLAPTATSSWASSA